MFNLFNRKSKDQKQKPNILISMPIFTDGAGYQVEPLIKHLELKWKFNITDFKNDSEVVSFNINGETIAIAFIPMQIPQDDIEGTAQYAYNWPNALEELKDHTGHAIVSMINGQKSELERFEILSKLLYSILTTSDAIAIYQGSQSLLVPRKQYLDHIENLQEGDIPVMLWVYIGLRNSENGNSAYTYGLKDFGKKEIETINSKLSLEELFDFLYNITSYIIANDVELKEGETVGTSVDQKILVKISRGQFVDGSSIKLEV